jgi:hypothetical protein
MLAMEVKLQRSHIYTKEARAPESLRIALPVNMSLYERSVEACTLSAISFNSR